MQDKLFYAPISLNLGEEIDSQITSLSDMESFLQSWPARRRGELYQIALKACETAQQGYITTDQARHALVTFAEAVGVLRTDLEPEIASRTVVRGYGGFAA